MFIGFGLREHFARRGKGRFRDGLARADACKLSYAPLRSKRRNLCVRTSVPLRLFNQKLPVGHRGNLRQMRDAQHLAPA